MTDLWVVMNHPYLPERNATESTFEELLASWDGDQDSVIPDRLTHAKHLKHTRHWVPEHHCGMCDDVGYKALNTSYIVDIDRWAANLKEDMRKLMVKVANEQLGKATSEIVRSGIANAMHARGRGNADARSAVQRVFGSTEDASKAVSVLLRPLEQLVSDAATKHSRRVRDLIRELDRGGASMNRIKDEVRTLIGDRSSWRTGLARYLTTNLYEGAREAAYTQAGDLVTKQWNTVEDEKVRPTHRGVDGKVRKFDKKWRVGKWWMSRPGDPSAGPEERMGCRCWLGWSIADEWRDFFVEHAY